MNLSQTVTWIPVSERLPESSGVYKVAGADYISGRNAVGRTHFDKDDAKFVGFTYGVAGYPSGDVITHWAEPLKHPSECKAEVISA